MFSSRFLGLGTPSSWILAHHASPPSCQPACPPGPRDDAGHDELRRTTAVHQTASKVRVLVPGGPHDVLWCVVLGSLTGPPAGPPFAQPLLIAFLQVPGTQLSGLRALAPPAAASQLQAAGSAGSSYLPACLTACWPSCLPGPHDDEQEEMRGTTAIQHTPQHSQVRVLEQPPPPPPPPCIVEGSRSGLPSCQAIAASAT